MVSFPRQPIASRFKRAATESEEFCNLEVMGCRTCGLVQLRSIPAIETLRPRFDWLRYNEPEAHLDEVAGVVSGLAPRDKTAVGLTYKDNSFLARLGERGLSATDADLAVGPWRGSLRRGGSRRWPAGWAAAMRKSACRGAGLVVARHVLEHCDRPVAAVGAMLSWLGEGGLLLVEVPGCREALERGIPELLWEEHASYFTEPTLRRLLEASGAEIVHFSEHLYPFESSLVAIVQPAAEKPMRLTGEDFRCHSSSAYR